ncbi:hypothetical protein JCM10207_006001 [Rhodosporidiobolus poonsookiae]
MFRLSLVALLGAASLSSALSIPREPLEPRSLLNLDLAGTLLKNPITGAALVDLDSTLDLLKGGKVLDLDADAALIRNSRGSAVLDAAVDATVGGARSLLDAAAQVDVLKNGKNGNSLLGADVDATVASAKMGLLDVAATVTGGDRDLAGVVVKSGSKALIDLDILGTLLGPTQCTGNAVIGVKAELTVGNLLHVCACIEVLSLGDSNKSACPACPAFADPICGSGTCGCKCRNGYFADPSRGCLPIKTCTSSGGHLRRHTDGTSSCECPSPFVSDNSGGCTLPPSARARRLARQPSQLSLRSSDSDNGAALVEGDAYRCPDGERACPIGQNGSWECLDVTNSLEACGGCPGERVSNDCTKLPGAEHVACVDSRCVISSCFPGFRYLNGRCVRTARD